MGLSGGNRVKTETIKVDRKIYICSVCKKKYYDYTKEYADGSLEKIDGYYEASECQKQCKCKHEDIIYGYGKGRYGENRGFFQECKNCGKILSEIEKDTEQQIGKEEIYNLAKKYYKEHEQNVQCKCENKNYRYGFDLSFYRIFFDKKCSQCHRTLYTINLGSRFYEQPDGVNQHYMKEACNIMKKYYKELIK